MNKTYHFKWVSLKQSKPPILEGESPTLKEAFIFILESISDSEVSALEDSDDGDNTEVQERLFEKEEIKEE